MGAGCVSVVVGATPGVAASTDSHTALSLARAGFHSCRTSGTCPAWKGTCHAQNLVQDRSSRRRGGLGVNAATSTATPTRSTADSPFEQRGDIRNLPTALQDRLELLANRPSTFAPMTAFSEAPTPSKLFQYYLLDTRHFQPNVFTTTRS